MKHFIFKKTALLCIFILLFTVCISCAEKNKQTLLSDNIGKEVKQEKNEINKTIETANQYLKDGKYEDAKKTYEKAISMDISNKQTYLYIKDKYIEKGRFDDGFYFIKLAMGNNVDNDNMKTQLEDIKKKFEVTNIDSSVYQNDKYTLPTELKIKINNEEEVMAKVKWNSNTIDTSKVGSFTINGTTDKYERPVTLKLNVQAIAKNKKIGKIQKIYESNGKKYLILDEVEFYRDADAVKEAKKDGNALQENGQYFVYDDYYIRDTSNETKIYEISDNASFYLSNFQIDPNYQGNASLVSPVSYATFKSYINTRGSENSRSTLCWIYTENNVVVKAEFQYTP